MYSAAPTLNVRPKAEVQATATGTDSEAPEPPSRSKMADQEKTPTPQVAPGIEVNVPAADMEEVTYRGVGFPATADVDGTDLQEDTTNRAAKSRKRKFCKNCCRRSVGGSDTR